MKLSKEKLFYIFLIFNAVLWSLIQLFRNVISIDAMEAVLWGELADFGTNKHPPLSGWIMGGFYNLFGQHDWIAYILGPCCIAIGLVFIYKLAKIFISEEKALCASMIITCCYYYTFTLFIDNFNCNFLSIALWPIIAYYYYKSVNENKLADWVRFGIFSGLGALAKYQVIFLFLALLIHLVCCDRKQFKQKGMYIAILTGGIVILPHILWLIKNDFFSFAYMTAQAQGGETVLASSLFERVFFPVKFTADQILSVIPCIVLYGITAFQAKNIKFRTNSKNISDSIFIGAICIIPVIALGLMGVLTGNIVHGIWGSIMIGFTGLGLFYFFPVEFKENTYSFFLKGIYIFVILWMIGMIIFSQLQVKLKVSYPYQTILPDLNSKWEQETKGAPLKYVGGQINYIFHFRIYDKNKPRVILETFGYKNPWIDHEDVVNSGAIILGQTPDDVISRAKETVILLEDNSQIVPEQYDFEIKNKVGRTKKYTLFYAIIPPQKNS